MRVVASSRFFDSAPDKTTYYRNEDRKQEDYHIWFKHLVPDVSPAFAVPEPGGWLD